MSQFNSNDVNTKFTIDATEVAPKVDAASKKVEEFKGKAEAGTASFSDGIKKSIGAVTSFIGSLTAAIGSATLFYEIGQRIGNAWRESLKTAKESAEEFRLSLDSVDFNKTLEATQKKIAETEGLLAEELAKDTPGTQRFIKRYEEQLKELRALEQQFIKQQRADGKKDRLKTRLDEKKEEETAYKERLKKLEELNQSIIDAERNREDAKNAVIRDSSDDEQAILLERDERIKAVRDAFSRDDEQDQREALVRQAEVNASVKIGELRKKEQDEIDGRHNRVMEQIQQRREAELQAIQSIRDAYRELAEEQTRGLGFNQSSGLGVTGNSTDLFNSLIRRAGR